MRYRPAKPAGILDRSGQYDPLNRPEAELPSLLGAAIDYPAGTLLDWHEHATGQLLYATQGSMTVLAEDGRFVVPPLMALWLAPGVGHRIAMRGQVAMRTLYFRRDALPLPQHRCAVLRVSPLLRELVLAAIATPAAATARHDSIACLVADELRAATAEPLALQLPRDPRAARVADALIEDAADGRTLAAWSRRVGASPRTLERLFLQETGMSFRQWRQQARLLQAVLLLGEGRPVTQVALDVGYAGQSAFTYMFRQALGVAPVAYFRGRAGAGSDGGTARRSNQASQR